MYAEWGSSSATMPLIAPSTTLVRWAGSTYWFSTSMSTRASWSNGAYGLSACVVAKASCEVTAPPANAAKTSPIVCAHPDLSRILRR
jgi:hypothetical protein